MNVFNYVVDVVWTLDAVDVRLDECLNSFRCYSCERSDNCDSDCRGFRSIVDFLFSFCSLIFMSIDIYDSLLVLIPQAM